MIDWVFGSGEAYLSTSRDIGDSVITCEILRKEHEEFELNARVSLPLFALIFSVETFAALIMYNVYALEKVANPPPLVV